MMGWARTMRRSRLYILVLGTFFAVLVAYWFLSNVASRSPQHMPHIGKYAFEPEDIGMEIRKVRPVVSIKDSINAMKERELLKDRKNMLLKKDETATVVNKTSVPKDKKGNLNVTLNRDETHAPKKIKSKAEKEDEEAVEQYKMSLLLRRQLKEGVIRGGPILLKFDNYSIPAYDLSKNYLQWQEEIGNPSDVEVGSQGIYPTKFRPEVGNGHIATVAFSNRLHINNFFIGAGKKSRRASLPTLILRNITRVRLNNNELEPESRRYSMNFATGVFTQVISGPGIVIEQRIYAHRRFSPLFVHEIDVFRTDKGNSSKEPMMIRLDFDPDVSDVASDITLRLETYPHKPGDEMEHAFGEHVEPENPKFGKKQNTKINIMYTILPKFLKTKLDGGTRRVKWNFFLSVNEKESVALEHFEIGSHLIRMGDWLYLTHLDAWRHLWRSGRVQVSSVGSQLPSNLLSAQYYIMSSLPWIPFKDYTFGGISPCGLAHGGGSNDHGFFGHVFWDQDLWIFPGILLLHPRIARQSMLQYRLDRLDAAKANAQKDGWRGAKFPWESAVSGLEVASDQENLLQYHVTGAVSLAAVNYVLATNDTSFLNDEGGHKLLSQIAEFWISQLTRVVTSAKKDKDSKKIIKKFRYEIWNAMGPDEFHARVNNSAYTNAIARFSLEALSRVAKFTGTEIGDTEKKLWNIANKIYIPLNHEPRYHPEFDGYKMGSTIKQADVVLMGYPLHYVFDTERRNDLLIYEKALNNGPGMSWGMHAIGWLELKEEEKASSAFKLQMMHIQPPFKVWSEYSSGGRTNFITAAGGFLQSIINGYFGLRLRTSGLYFDPRIPYGGSEMNITGLDYLANSFDIYVNDKGVQIRCVGFDGGAPRLETEVFNASPQPIIFYPGKWVELPFGRGVIRVTKTGLSWPRKAWTMNPLEIEKKIIKTLNTARKASVDRMKKIEEFREATKRRIQLRRRNKKKDEPTLEEIVAKKLRRPDA